MASPQNERTLTESETRLVTCAKSLIAIADELSQHNTTLADLCVYISKNVIGIVNPQGTQQEGCNCETPNQQPSITISKEDQQEIDDMATQIQKEMNNNG